MKDDRLIAEEALEDELGEDKVLKRLKWFKYSLFTSYLIFLITTDLFFFDWWLLLGVLTFILLGVVELLRIRRVKHITDKYLYL